MSELDRKKPFSTLEKDVFLNIIQNYDAILTLKQTNATSALKKKHAWEKIREEFNEASIVTQKWDCGDPATVSFIGIGHGYHKPASTKQLIKLWYNMKAKARESKTKENIRHLTGGGPPVVDMDPIDARVMDVDKNILTNIMVDIDSDIDGSLLIEGDNNNEAWCKIRDVTMQATQEKKEEDKTNMEYKTPIKKTYECNNKSRINKIDLLKCKILEEELEFKKKLHEEELKIKILEREHKEIMYKLEIEIKLKELNGN